MEHFNQQKQSHLDFLRLRQTVPITNSYLPELEPVEQYPRNRTTTRKQKRLKIFGQKKTNQDLPANCISPIRVFSSIHSNRPTPQERIKQLQAEVANLKNQLQFKERELVTKQQLWTEKQGKYSEQLKVQHAELNQYIITIQQLNYHNSMYLREIQYLRHESISKKLGNIHKKPNQIQITPTVKDLHSNTPINQINHNKHFEYVSPLQVNISRTTKSRRSSYISNSLEYNFGQPDQSALMV